MKTCEPWRTLVIFGLDKPYNLSLVIRKKVSFPCFSAKCWASLQHLLFFCFLFSGLSSDGPTSNKYRATFWGHSEFRCLVELLERNIQKKDKIQRFWWTDQVSDSSTFIYRSDPTPAVRPDISSQQDSLWDSRTKSAKSNQQNWGLDNVGHVKRNYVP